LSGQARTANGTHEFLEAGSQKEKDYFKFRGKKKRSNNPPEGESWIWLTREMMFSDAWRLMTINERKALDRILLEHMAHAGTENGDLIVTHSDFIEYGVTPRYVADAIAGLEYLGFIKRTFRGGCRNDTNQPSRFWLAFMPDWRLKPPTNRWKSRTEQQIKTWRAKRKRCRHDVAEWEPESEQTPQRGGTVHTLW
jgi:hypothetical protein